MPESAVSVANAYKKAEKDEIRDLARSHTKAAVQTLARLMKAPKTPPGVKRQCAMDLISQGWGRPDSRADSGGVTAEKAGLTINILRLSTNTVETIRNDNDVQDVVEAVDVARMIEAGVIDG
jgi:hypothetical protein